MSLVQWVGGKGQQVDDLLGLVPYTERYVEPYGGGASLLLNRRQVPTEVYNDLNEEVVNLFQVMRDPDTYLDFERWIELTMFSKHEFRTALDVLYGKDRDTHDRLARAWATYVVQNMGISGKHHKSVGNWSRSFDGSKNVERWWRRYEKLERIHDRLRGVQIDSQDALTCMAYWDSPETTFYVDPPYVLSTRDQEYYQTEATDDDHRNLMGVLEGLQGAVVLSGYQHPIYEILEAQGWHRTDYGASAIMKVSSEAKPRRVECVWRNQKALLYGEQRPLF